MLNTANSVKLDGTGAGSVYLYASISTLKRVVSQIAITTTPVQGGCTANVYLNGVFLFTSYRGSGDTAQGDPPIVMYGGDSLAVTWASGPANGTASATFSYEDKPR